MDALQAFFEKQDTICYNQKTKNESTGRTKVQCIVKNVVFLSLYKFRNFVKIISNLRSAS